ncbi:TPA: acid stress response transcriptional regulator YdeO [Escherichia coli]|nr:acid stress response transcriptional regulator YdeO [Escherichia coli]HDS0538784.1 acid stress response transcriptional regulator YdeO [Escherichia coli]
MSLVCSVIFIHHAFNANILDKDYAFSDGEILMVDNAVRTHFEPYERHFKEIGFNENTIKKYLQCTNIQTVTMPVPAKFLRTSNVPTGLLNEMIAYLNSEERNHHNFSELLLFSCLSIFATCKGFITLLTNGVLSVSGKVRNIVNMKLAHPWKLKDICDCLYISESLLKKKLKQEQTTFSQILLDARMQHAKNLIRVEGSVNKIATQCGYASTSYFIYAFRKHFGNSPKRVSKEYRCQRHTGMNTDNTMSALAI